MQKNSSGHSLTEKATPQLPRKLTLIMKQLEILSTCSSEKEYFQHTQELMILIAEHLKTAAFPQKKDSLQIPYAQQAMECALDHMWEDWHDLTKKPRDH